MFFQPSSTYYHSHPGHGFSAYGDAAGPSRRRLGAIEEEEEELAEARERLMAWARQLRRNQENLERTQSELEGREANVAARERMVEKELHALRQRVAVLDAADRAGAQRSEAALRNAAASVIQRALRRVLEMSKAKLALAGIRTLRDLEARFEKAHSEYQASGNLLLLEDTLTKLLEKADAIITANGPRTLRSRRKAFVREVMHVLENATSKGTRNIDDDADSSSMSSQWSDLE